MKKIDYLKPYLYKNYINEVFNNSSNRCKRGNWII